jgi:hypothetical protein
MANIHSSLKNLIVDIDSLSFLENNPRKGDVRAIAASYEEFGQVKPIVAKKNEDGTATVIAGNHQLQAARQLGWDKIACVFLDADDDRAIAYALADNRTMELGKTDNDMLSQLLVEVSDIYPELWNDLGWDEFEMASINETIASQTEVLTGSQYFAPVIVQPNVEGDKEIRSMLERNEDGDMEIIAPNGMDHNEVAIKGSTVAARASAPQAVVQYTIVFDSPDQQSKWYSFIKWLRSDPGVDGSTTAEKLIDFIEQHPEV